MTNKKISALSSATTPLTGSEIVPINQSSVTDSVSVANLTAGRAVSALSVTSSTIGATTSTNLNLQSNGTTNAILDTNGNLGVGVTPSAYGSGYKAINIGFAGTGIFAGSGTNMLLTSNWYYNGTNNVYASNGYALGYSQYNGQHQWNVAGSGTANTLINGTGSFTTAMTLDNSGNLLVGANAGSGTGTQQGFAVSPSNGFTVASHANGTASGTAYIYFNYNAGTIGSITQSGTTAVLYNTTSDYRLKSNVQPVTTGLSIINQLNPVNFTWISDNEADTGFLAHEFQAVIPRSVTGEKDATKTEEYEVTPAVKDENGNVTTPAVMGTRTVPVYQQMDNSGAVPYLVAAIQELSTQIITLQNQVTVLENK